MVLRRPPCACHVGHQKGRADAVSRVVFQEDAPDWDLLLSRHAVVLQFVSEREVHREQLRGLTETIIKGAPKRLGIMDDPQIVLFLDRQTDGTVPSRRPCRDSFGHDPPPSVARGRRSWPFCLVMSASSCPPKSVTVRKDQVAAFPCCAKRSNDIPRHRKNPLRIESQTYTP